MEGSQASLKTTRTISILNVNLMQVGREGMEGRVALCALCFVLCCFVRIWLWLHYSMYVCTVRTGSAVLTFWPACLPRYLGTWVLACVSVGEDWSMHCTVQ